MRDESPSGPWFGAESTLSALLLMVTLQTANASKKGADTRHPILFGREEEDCYGRPNWEIASRGV